VGGDCGRSGDALGVSTVICTLVNYEAGLRRKARKSEEMEWWMQEVIHIGEVIRKKQVERGEKSEMDNDPSHGIFRLNEVVDEEWPCPFNSERGMVRTSTNRTIECTICEMGDSVLRLGVFGTHLHEETEEEREYLQTANFYHNFGHSGV